MINFQQTSCIFARNKIKYIVAINGLQKQKTNQLKNGGYPIMSVKVAINGFGRIGRLAFRQMF
ncbi:MAG: hypothetical protein MR379_09895, partial [Clostridiales bacterium]|nr:hypothetical protein [Clostridiales bacterium]